MKTEVGRDAVVHLGEDLLLEPLVTLHRPRRVHGAAVHESVLLAGVAVEVAVELDFATLERLAHHQLDRVDFWEQLHRGRQILPIQVVARKAASVVANYDSVGVEHRHDFEDEALSESAGHLFVADQELQQPLHDVGAVAFSWVHSPCENDALPPRNIVLRTLKIGYYKHL